MPHFIRDPMRYVGIPLNVPKNLKVTKGLNVEKRVYKKTLFDGSEGNAIYLELNKNNCEVSTHISVVGEKSVKLWGQVKDCEGHPVEDALIKLLKPVSQDGNIDYVGVDHTTSDNLGFYKFELSPNNENIKLIVIASKAISGNQRTIDENSSLCNPCEQ